MVTCSINDLHSAGGRNTGSSYKIPATSPRVEESWVLPVVRVVTVTESPHFRRFAPAGANENANSTRAEIISNNKAALVPFLGIIFHYFSFASLDDDDRVTVARGCGNIFESEGLAGRLAISDENAHAHAKTTQHANTQHPSLDEWPFLPFLFPAQER